MKLKKIFDPLMLVRSFRSREPGKVWWENKEQAREYARFLAAGLTAWSTIDILALLVLAFAAFFLSTKTVLGLFVIIVVFGTFCPLILTVGVGLGCMKHLTLKETWEIVRDYFRE